jgi:hypothetical protein
VHVVMWLRGVLVTHSAKSRSFVYVCTSVRSFVWVCVCVCVCACVCGIVCIYACGIVCMYASVWDRLCLRACVGDHLSVSCVYLRVCGIVHVIASADMHVIGSECETWTAWRENAPVVGMGWKRVYL